jgi:hypothetical protein
MSKTRNDAIIELGRAGWKLADLAVAFDLSIPSVNRICLAAGVTRYTPRAKQPEPVADVGLKSPKSRRAAEIRAKYLQWAREAEVA